jgi:Trk K+ transport system NAD-binding subunit
MEIDVEEVPQEIEGLPMKDTHLPDRYSINVVVIRRNDNYITVDKDTVIQKGDRITVLGPYKNIKHLFQND